MANKLNESWKYVDAYDDKRQKLFRVKLEGKDFVFGILEKKHEEKYTIEIYKDWGDTHGERFDWK